MTLADQAIMQALSQGLVIEDPRPDVLQPASVDLHLGRELLRVKAPLIDPTKPLDPERSTERFMMDGGWILNPGFFILGHTQEWVEVPRHLVAIVTGKSSLARIGLQIEAAGYADPGWKGRLTLEIYNMGPAMIILRPGMPICQLRIAPIVGEVLNPYGSPVLGSHYQSSPGVVAARFGSDSLKVIPGQDVPIVGQGVSRIVTPILGE